MVADGNLSAIIEMICRIGSVSTLQPDQDFYDAGFTSVNALPLLMEIEDQFQITVPDERFINARTPRDLQQMVDELRKG